jgi:hypothetical protein
MKLLGRNKAVDMGFSADKRKRRNEHRAAAKKLLKSGGFFNCYSARGSTFGQVAAWHLSQARLLTYS